MTVDERFRQQLREGLAADERRDEQTRQRVLVTLRQRARRQRVVGIAVAVFVVVVGAALALVSAGWGTWEDRDFLGKCVGLAPLAFMFAGFAQFFVFWSMDDGSDPPLN